MWANELYQKARTEDFLREAERDREILDAIKKSGRKPFYKPVLSTLGAKLVEVGTRLQDNVESGSATPVFRATERA